MSTKRYRSPKMANSSGTHNLRLYKDIAMFLKLVRKPALFSANTHNVSRRKVQKLRDQSQYISKNVRALQYWRWACGTCCKQYHMLFYIQMAVVSTAIFFLFSPSFSFFLEIKVQIYIYFHNKCQYIKQFPPKP